MNTVRIMAHLMYYLCFLLIFSIKTRREANSDPDR